MTDPVKWTVTGPDPSPDDPCSLDCYVSWNGEVKEPTLSRRMRCTSDNHKENKVAVTSDFSSMRNSLDMYAHCDPREYYDDNVSSYFKDYPFPGSTYHYLMKCKTWCDEDPYPPFTPPPSWLPPQQPYLWAWVSVGVVAIAIFLYFMLKSRNKTMPSPIPPTMQHAQRINSADIGPHQ